MRGELSNLKESFYSLDHSHILNSLEAALGVSAGDNRRCTGRLMALNSIENRVLSFDLENGEEYVAKFYRPGRWSLEQLEEEHNFLTALYDYEVPIVKAIDLPGGNTSCSKISKTTEDIYFCIFPKVRGRLKDELQNEELTILGRYLARLHIVGSQTKFKFRKTFTVDNWLWDSVDFLDKSPLANNPMAERYLQLVDESAELLGATIANLKHISIHGDCHCGNVLWNEQGPFFTDFDDCITGPPVQDLWMILRGRDAQDERQREIFLEAYESIYPFEKETLHSIEALRALRMLHYNAWIARRWDDPSFPKLFPHFGSPEWWREEIQALNESLERLTNPHK